MIKLLFCATNVKELFGQWYDAQKVLQLLPSYRYESFTFELSSPWIPLWDSQKEERGISEVVRAIDEGRVFAGSHAGWRGCLEFPPRLSCNVQ